jgi:hypothetical protein
MLLETAVDPNLEGGAGVKPLDRIDQDMSTLGLVQGADKADSQGTMMGANPLLSWW